MSRLAGSPADGGTLTCVIYHTGSLGCFAIVRYGMARFLPVAIVARRRLEAGDTRATPNALVRWTCLSGISRESGPSRAQSQTPHRGLRGLALGYLVSGASLGAAAGAILAGPASDRFGRKTLLIIDAGIYAVGAILSAARRTTAA